MTFKQWLQIILLSSIWGATFLFLRIAVPDAGVVATTTIRVAFATILLGAVCWYLGHLKTWPDKKKMALLSLVNSAIPFGLFSFAAQYLPAGYMSIINASAPMQGLIIGVVLYKDAPLTMRTWAGVLLGFVGVGSMAALGPVEMNTMTVLAMLAALAGAFCYALTSYWTVHWFKNMAAPKLAFQNQLMALGWLLPWMLTTPNQPMQTPSTTMWALALAGILCTGIAYLLYFRILREVGPVRASTVSFLIPCFAILWSALFLDESITQGHIFGIICIILAVRWIQPRKESIPTIPRRIHTTSMDVVSLRGI